MNRKEPKYLPVIVESDDEDSDQWRSSSGSSDEAEYVYSTRSPSNSAVQDEEADPDAVDGLERELDTFWKQYKVLKFRLKLEHLNGPNRQEEIKSIPPDANFVTLSEYCVDDMLGSGRLVGDSCPELKQMLEICQAKIQVETALVHTSQLTCSLDRTKDMGRIGNFIDMIQEQNRPVGVFAQANSRAQAFKKVVEILHSHYVQK